MEHYLTKEDLPCINEALNRGEDVRIQRTKNSGCRILSDKVSVLKKKGMKETEE